MKNRAQVILIVGIVLVFAGAAAELHQAAIQLKQSLFPHSVGSSANIS